MERIFFLAIPMILADYSWLGTQELLLKVSKGPYGMQLIEPRNAPCIARTSPLCYHSRSRNRFSTNIFFLFLPPLYVRPDEASTKCVCTDCHQNNNEEKEERGEVQEKEEAHIQHRFETQLPI